MPDDEKPPLRPIEGGGRKGFSERTLRVVGEPGFTDRIVHRETGERPAEPLEPPVPLDGYWAAGISADLGEADEIAKALDSLVRGDGPDRIFLRITGRIEVRVVERDGRKCVQVSPSVKIKGEKQSRRKRT